MNLVCSIRGHRPGGRVIVNDGTRFARCVRCGTDLLLLDGVWAPPPKGCRVVWKQGPANSPETAPAAEAASASAPPPQPASDAPKPLFVLVCDDDTLVVELLTHRLAGRGFRVGVAGDGREALGAIARDPPDAILLDAMMPVVDGYEVLRLIRS